MAETAPAASERLYRAAVGPNADYYVPLFLGFDATPGTQLSWNWPAFLASFYWFLYRRMYGLWAIYVVLVPLALALGAAIVTQAGVPRLLGELACLGFQFVWVPLIANRLYHRTIRERIAAVRSHAGTEAAQVAALEAQSPVSPRAVAIAIAAMVALTALASCLMLQQVQQIS